MTKLFFPHISIKSSPIWQENYRDRLVSLDDKMYRIIKFNFIGFYFMSMNVLPSSTYMLPNGFNTDGD